MGSILTVFLLLGSAPVWAQGTATVVGRVTDATGAVVSGAKVTARNLEIGLERTTTTSDTGDYELPLLPITGSYTLTIGKEGFQTHEHTGLVLQVDQRARIDVSMRVGAVSAILRVASVTMKLTGRWTMFSVQIGSRSNGRMIRSARM